MTPYADLPSRRTRQVVADVLGAVWVLTALWFAKEVYDLVYALDGFGESVESSALRLRDAMQGASDGVDGIPLAGSALASPFGAAADAAQAMAETGRDAQDAVHDLAALLAVALAGVPILLALVVWVWPRVHWMRRAAAAREVLADRDGAELLALRALANRPLRQLAVVGADGLMDRWRRGDAGTVRALATIELGALGLDARRLP